MASGRTGLTSDVSTRGLLALERSSPGTRGHVEVPRRASRTRAEFVVELLPSLRALAFGREGDWRRAWGRSRSRGGASAWSARSASPSSVTTSALDLRCLPPWCTVEARVVHVLPSAEGRRGGALRFVDVAAAPLAPGGARGGNGRRRVTAPNRVPGGGDDA